MGKLIINKEEAQLAVWNDSDKWEEIESNVIDNSRWSVQKEGIFKHIESGKFYSFNWQQGATETQDERPFEYESEVTVIEVEQKEVTVKKWVVK